MQIVGVVQEVVRTIEVYALFGPQIVLLGFVSHAGDLTGALVGKQLVEHSGVLGGLFAEAGRLRHRLSVVRGFGSVANG